MFHCAQTREETGAAGEEGFSPLCVFRGESSDFRSEAQGRERSANRHCLRIKKRHGAQHNVTQRNAVEAS